MVRSGGLSPMFREETQGRRQTPQGRRTWCPVSRAHIRGRNRGGWDGRATVPPDGRRVPAGATGMISALRQRGRETVSHDAPTGPVVIGAGFGRTGTTSLKRALDDLGIGLTYHGEDLIW